MRLLYITNSRMPTEKAHGFQIMKTVQAMEQSGADVTLLIPSRKNYIKTNIAEFYNVKIQSRVIRVLDLVRCLQYISEKIYFPFQRLWFLVASFFYGLFWRGNIYSRDITVVFLLSLFGKKVAYEDHEPKQSHKKLYALFLRHIPKKVIVARGLVDLYKEFGVKESSCALIANGVDVKEFDQVSADKQLWSKEFGIKEDARVALYVGHFYRWKGVYTLLDSAKNVNVAVVLIGGTKEDFAAVEQYVKNNNISNVYLKRFIEHSKVIEFAKSADVLVLPNTAKEERSQKYTTPIKLFEYMASEVPIIASNISSFKYYLKDRENALLCEPDSADDLAKAINRLSEDSNLQRKLAEQAKKDVQEYDWKKRAQKIIDFIS